MEAFQLGQTRSKRLEAATDLAASDGATGHEVRQATLVSCTAATTVFLGWSWWDVANARTPDSSLLWLLQAATLALVPVWALVTSGSRWARPSYLAVISLTLATYQRIAPAGSPAYLWLLVALLAGVLVRPGAAILAAGCGVGVTLALGADPHAPALLVFGGAAVWLALRPLYDLLRRYSAQSMEAIILAERLRDERAKLSRSLHDLDASYRLMERTSRELGLACREADALRDMRHRFATNLSHELRTPLNIVLGFTRLIYSHPETYGYDGWSLELTRDLAEIQRSASYLSQLVDDIVDLARADALAMPVRREPCQIVDLAEEAVELVRNLARRKGLELLTKSEGPAEAVAADPVRIRQVLYNLLTNAVRNTDSGTVAVVVRHLPEEVQVTVEDTGRGIEADQIEVIFNEFYQLGQPSQGPEPGKGLGLAIAKRFVQLHGGRIWADSEPGRGSAFSFSLSRSDKSVSLSPPPPAPLYGTALPPRVLLHGDDGAAERYLSRRLEGYQFLSLDALPRERWAEHLSGAAAVLANRSHLGDDSGDMARLLDALPPSLPVIECCLPTPAWLGRGRPFVDVLTKPVALHDLEALIGRILGKRSAACLLIADDDRGFARLVVRTLAAAGRRDLRTVTAYSGKEALAKARDNRPDLVLMDLVMPEMTGFEAAQVMQADPELCDVPIVAVTAATPGEDRVEVSGIGLSVRRSGGFSPGELAGLLQVTLDVVTRRPVAPQGTR